ncbi:unknown protein [Waddlia chondrophila 2032/99]|uniref:Uncharacterized protein n=1 Tax=Waddlia chondrophila 2032/99 TaxID=765953 RepID=F8LBJ4_9BACT|nr:unknown protein [Waddlia chondrophila 2032/99]
MFLENQEHMIGKRSNYLHQPWTKRSNNTQKPIKIKNTFSSFKPLLKKRTVYNESTLRIKSFLMD